MAIFTGAGVAIITPFHADGSINYEKLEELIDYHCNNGTIKQLEGFQRSIRSC